MPTLFTKIINGQIPGRFVWRDPQVVVFMTIEPLTPGHALVVPVAEVEQWTDLDHDVAARTFEVAGHVGRAQKAAFGSPRAGVIIAGFEVPHAHVHVFPAESESQFDFRKARADTPAEELDAAAATLRDALRAAGHTEVCD